MQPSSLPASDAGGAEIEPDDAIRAVVKRLARPHRSGGSVIERAAIMAEGPSSAAVMRWIADHHGEPEALPVSKAKGGLHAERFAREAGPPSRFVLPPGALSA
jgi:hypothetical protein